MVLLPHVSVARPLNFSDGFQNLIRRARFGQERKGRRSHRLFHQLAIGKSGVHNDRERTPGLADFFQRGRPVQGRHGQIQQDDIRSLAAHFLQGFAAVASDPNIVMLRNQKLTKHIQHVRVVVHQQQIRLEQLLRPG